MPYWLRVGSSVGHRFFVGPFFNSPVSVSRMATFFSSPSSPPSESHDHGRNPCNRLASQNHRRTLATVPGCRHCWLPRGRRHPEGLNLD
jgi:hypothetical protein